MTETNNQMLVTLNISDLKQLIQSALNSELENFKILFQLNPKKSEHETDLLSREETAKLLGVSTTTLFLWNRDKILEHTKLNRRVYYSKKEVYNKLNLKAIA